MCNRDLGEDSGSHASGSTPPPGSTIYASAQDGALGNGFNQVLSSQAAQMLQRTHPKLHAKVAARWEALKAGGGQGIGGNYVAVPTGTEALAGLARSTTGDDGDDAGGGASKGALGYDACVADYATQVSRGAGRGGGGGGWAQEPVERSPCLVHARDDEAALQALHPPPPPLQQYLNKAEVKSALHAEGSISWSECSASVLYVWGGGVGWGGGGFDHRQPRLTTAATGRD